MLLLHVRLCQKIQYVGTKIPSLNPITCGQSSFRRIKHLHVFCTPAVTEIVMRKPLTAQCRSPLTALYRIISKTSSPRSTNNSFLFSFKIASMLSSSSDCINSSFTQVGACQVTKPPLSVMTKSSLNFSICMHRFSMYSSFIFGRIPQLG